MRLTRRDFEEWASNAAKSVQQSKRGNPMRKLILALCATAAIAVAPFTAAGTASAAPATTRTPATASPAVKPPNASHWIYLAHFTWYSDCDDNAYEIVKNGWYAASYCSWNPAYGHWDLHGLTWN
jgi:hypothetical protein